ncbi:MAG: hypothetical protein EAX95_15960, partial [Candidatus Thorarchaeota archaeon]|nr:hypothetical protein [Candidatus Thorarchaeota archaeon]
MSKESSHPYSPARTLARAHLTGLSALKDLVRERVIKSIRPVYERTLHLWAKAQEGWEQSKRDGNRNFSHITEVERHLRRNQLKLIWETTARYGNTEYKRVRSEREGRVGPMNRLLNMAGAQLRNYAMTRFPFPEPEQRGTERGYWGDDTFPWVDVIHRTLPELDFIDMIRAHVFELCRKCFIYAVPVRDARSYVNLLIWRLSPFLEHLYTSGESGRWGSKRTRKRKKTGQEKCADEILRDIVEELRALYTMHYGYPVPPTHMLSEERKFDMGYFANEAGRLRVHTEGFSQEEVHRQDQQADLILGLCSRGILRDIDAEKLGEEYVQRTRWHGIKWHELMTNGLVQPHTLRNVVLEGDRYAAKGDTFMVMAEVSVRTTLGRGRADLVVFRRELVKDPLSPQDRPVWRPVAVFEIKSKTSLNWWMEEEKRKSKKHGDITVIDYRFRRRGLTDAEWETELAGRDDTAVRQLAAYAQGLVSEYEELTGVLDAAPPITGTIVMDTSHDAGMMRECLLRLLASMFGAEFKIPPEYVGKPLVVRLDDKSLQSLRYALILHTITRPQYKMLGEQGFPVDSDHEVTYVREGEDRPKFILHLSAASATSSGVSAAWIAQYWHGLELLKEETGRHARCQILWLDLTGDFFSRGLAWTRLRMDSQSQEIQQLFNRIEWMDLSEEIRNHLFNGSELKLNEIIPPDADGERTLVVSGWDYLKACTPPRLARSLHAFEKDLLDTVTGQSSSILWFSDPDTDESTSSTYQRKKLKPFSKDSPLQRHVTEIEWTLPARPYAFGQKAPMIDDMRVIVRQTSTGIETSLFEVSVLENWSAKFWTQSGEKATKQTNQSRGRPLLTASEVLGIEQMAEDIQQSAFDLLPSRSGQSPISASDGISIAPLRCPDNKYPYPRLTFQPRPTKGGAGLAYVEPPMTSIQPTHPRGYRTPLLKEEAVGASRRPLLLSSLKMGGLDETAVYRIEVRRLRAAMDVVADIEPDLDGDFTSVDWNDFISVLADLLSDQRPAEEVAADVASLMRNHLVSRTFWNTVLWLKENSPKQSQFHLSVVALKGAIEKNPLLLQNTGNYLFLLLLALDIESTTLSFSQHKILWNSVQAWWFMQLGLRIDESMSPDTHQSVFDTRSIWTDLRRRTRSFLDYDVYQRTEDLYGRLFVVPGPETLDDYWLVVQDPVHPERLISGVWRGQNPLASYGSFHWCLVRYDEITKSASKCTDPTEIHDLLVKRMGDSLVLLLREDNVWCMLGELEIVPKHDTLTGIRGIRLSRYKDAFNTNFEHNDRVPPEVESEISRSLDSVSRNIPSCVPVRCDLTIEANDYVVALANPEDGDIQLEELRFRKTSNLVDFLRIPFTGCRMLPEMSVYREFYSWNPYEDIEYGDLTFLRPYVERKRPFRRFRTRLPRTADEISGLEALTARAVVTHDESICPVVHGDATSHGDCWHLKIANPTESQIPVLFHCMLSDFELTLLVRNGIVDGNTKWNLELEFLPNPRTREGIVFWESKLFARWLGLRRVDPGTHSRMNDEKIHWHVSKQGSLIWLYAKSSLTDITVYDGELLRLPPEIEMSSAIEHVESVL